jgi:hypothetical protein
VPSLPTAAAVAAAAYEKATDAGQNVLVGVGHRWAVIRQPCLLLQLRQDIVQEEVTI